MCGVPEVGVSERERGWKGEQERGCASPWRVDETWCELELGFPSLF